MNLSTDSKPNDMNGVVAAADGVNGQLEPVMPGISRTYRSIFVRPSISKGRGYAVVLLIREENNGAECSTIRSAPRTTLLVRKGRFNSICSSSSSFADLPVSLLQHIFAYVNDAKSILACSSVCNNWRRIITSTYVMSSDRSGFVRIMQSPPRLDKIFETTKLKIFCGSKYTGGIETSGQRKDTMLFREVTVKIDNIGENSSRLLSYLLRLAPFLTPTKAFLLADIALDDSLLIFLFNWQPRANELRFLRCSFAQVSSAGMKRVFEASRLRHLYIDDCPVSRTCPLANAPVLTRVCGLLTHLELCFRDEDAVISEIIDDQFLISVSSAWKTKSNIRWIKVSSAPKITTDGVEKVVQVFSKLRYGSRGYYGDDRKDFIKTPNLVLWLRDTAFDADDFLTRRYGKRWFRDDKLPTPKRRKLRDSYGGEDVVIWLEKT